MISKDTWNNVLTTTQRRKAINILFPNHYEDSKEEMAQKITTKLSERQKSILKAIKQIGESKRFEITTTQSL